MKSLILLLFLSLFIYSCGGMSKEEKDEMNAFNDSIKTDTIDVNNSVNAANDFLNDSLDNDSIVNISPIE